MCKYCSTVFKDFIHVLTFSVFVVSNCEMLDTRKHTNDRTVRKVGGNLRLKYDAFQFIFLLNVCELTVIHAKVLMLHVFFSFLSAVDVC